MISAVYSLFVFPPLPEGGPNYEETLVAPLLWGEGLVAFFLIGPTLG